jgi:hypothetical protein
VESRETVNWYPPSLSRIATEGLEFNCSKEITGATFCPETEELFKVIEVMVGLLFNVASISLGLKFLASIEIVLTEGSK